MIFKPEDFYDTTPMRVLAAHKANTKFNEWMSECPIMKAYKDTHGEWVCIPHSALVTTTHTARIFDIKEIEVKECKHVAYYNLEHAHGASGIYIEFAECKYCGKKLKLTSWEVVSE